jgi:hypothetical protein
MAAVVTSAVLQNAMFKTLSRAGRIAVHVSSSLLHRNPSRLCGSGFHQMAGLVCSFFLEGEQRDAYKRLYILEAIVHEVTLRSVCNIFECKCRGEF